MRDERRAAATEVGGKQREKSAERSEKREERRDHKKGRQLRKGSAPKREEGREQRKDTREKAMVRSLTGGMVEKRVGTSDSTRGPDWYPLPLWLL